MSHRQAAKADIQRYTPPSGRSTLRVLRAIYREKGLQAILVYRLGRSLDDAAKSILRWPLLVPGWVFYALALIIIRKGYDIKLSRSAKIGPGLFIGHFGGIELVNCSLGTLCSIGQETHIGAQGVADGPQIGDRVWIGSHSHIRGPVKIGDGATIGAGGTITVDVPSMALMIGNPARLASRQYDNSRYLGLS
jgi:serine O-acetyltransferase